MGLLFAQGIMMNRDGRCVHSAALWKTTLVHPAVHTGRFLSHPESIWRGGRKQTNPRGRASFAWRGGDKPRRGEGTAEPGRGGRNRVRDSVGGTTPGCITREAMSAGPASWSFCGSSVLPVVMTLTDHSALSTLRLRAAVLPEHLMPQKDEDEEGTPFVFRHRLPGP